MTKLIRGAPASSGLRQRQGHSSTEACGSPYVYVGSDENVPGKPKARKMPPAEQQGHVILMMGPPSDHCQPYCGPSCREGRRPNIQR